jgi:hypothetical protein
MPKNNGHFFLKKLEIQFKYRIFVISSKKIHMSKSKHVKLTAEQEADITITKDWWLERFFSCKNFLDKEKATEQINWLYKFSGFEKPKIIFCNSPYECQVVANREMNIFKGLNPDEQPMTYYQTSSYGNVSDYGWVAWEDYFIRHNLIQLDQETLDNFNNFKQLVLSNVYDMIQFDTVCIVSDMPVEIHRLNGKLHNPRGKAIKFKDGWGQYYINGRYIPNEIFQKAQTLTKKEFIKENNSDYKGAWYEILGQEKIMKLLRAKEVDKTTITHRNGDIETLTLYKTKEKFAEIDYQPFAWVKLTCPSTGTNYLLGVEPHHTSALEAAASISMFNKDDYSFDFRS